MTKPEEKAIRADERKAVLKEVMDELHKDLKKNKNDMFRAEKERKVTEYIISKAKYRSYMNTIDRIVQSIAHN